MTLKFFCRPLPGQDSPGPLLATASIPRDKADCVDARDSSKVEYFRPDTSAYHKCFPDWNTQLEFFHQTLEKGLNRYITAIHRPRLRPWSRQAFEQIAKFGISYLRHLVVVKLYEDDGTEWDPTTSIPLYGPNPGPFGKSGEVKIPTTSNMRTKGRINPPRPQTEEPGSTEDQTGE